MAQDILRLVIEIVDKATKPIRNIIGSLLKMDKANNKTRRSFFASSFGLMFLGRRLTSFADTAIKAITNAYTSAVDESNMFLKEVIGLQASFEFLKFSIFDALTQSELFIPLIDGVISMINAFAKFISQHPRVAEIVAVMVGWGAAGGTLLTALGMIKIAVRGLGGAFGPFLLAIVIITALIGLFFAAITDKNKDLTRLKDAFNKGLVPAFNRFKESLDGMVKDIFPNFDSAWDLFTSTLLWSITLVMEHISMVIDSFTMFIEIIRGALNALKAFAAFNMGQFKDSFSYLKEVGKNIDKIGDLSKNMLGTEIRAYQTFIAGPAAFSKSNLDTNTSQQSVAKEDVWTGVNSAPINVSINVEGSIISENNLDNTIQEALDKVLMNYGSPSGA